jgi:hypothetical protein
MSLLANYLADVDWGAIASSISALMGAGLCYWMEHLERRRARKREQEQARQERVRRWTQVYADEKE